MLKKIGCVLLLFVVFGAVAGPWYIRTAYYAPGGNPFYPKSCLWWAGEQGADFPWHHVSPEIKAGLESPRTWWVVEWESLHDPTGQVDGDQKLGGWGPWFAVLCVPAVGVGLLLMLRRKEWELIGLMVAVVVPWLAMPVDGQTWSRFILPVILVGFVGLGRVLKECEPK